MTQASVDQREEGPRSPFAELGLVFGLLAVSAAIILAVFGWPAWRYPQALTPAEIGQAPAGCVADRVQVEVTKGIEPVTYGRYQIIKRECELEEAIVRSKAEAQQILQRQREALGNK